jgi:hypothetical protein
MEIDIQETIAQLGGKGLTGALVYTGVSSIAIKNKDTLVFFVNGRRGHRTCISIQLDPSDTYNIELFSMRGTTTETHESRKNVYCDELKDLFESMYDNHMKVHNNGFIPC